MEDSMHLRFLAIVYLYICLSSVMSNVKVFFNIYLKETLGCFTGLLITRMAVYIFGRFNLLLKRVSNLFIWQRQRSATHWLTPQCPRLARWGQTPHVRGRQLPQWTLPGCLLGCALAGNENGERNWDLNSGFLVWEVGVLTAVTNAHPSMLSFLKRKGYD